jgi:hypothetical protein
LVNDNWFWTKPSCRKLQCETNIGIYSFIHSFIHAFTQMYTNNVIKFFKRPLFDSNLPFLAPNLLKESQNHVTFFCIPLLIWSVLFYTCGHIVDNIDSFHTFWFINMNGKQNIRVHKEVCPLSLAWDTLACLDPFY